MKDRRVFYVRVQPGQPHPAGIYLQAETLAEWLRTTSPVAARFIRDFAKQIDEQDDSLTVNVDPDGQNGTPSRQVRRAAERAKVKA